MGNYVRDRRNMAEDSADVTLMSQDSRKWEEEYLKLDHPTLFQLILAANFLNCQTLLDLTCKNVADQIRGKTPEQIRNHFNIRNDFTPEEEEEVRKENAWCEEAFK